MIGIKVKATSGKFLKRQALWFWEISVGQRRRIALSCLTGLANVVFILAFIWASKQVIDIAVGSTRGSLMHYGLITTALLVLQILCGMFDNWLNSRMKVQAGNTMKRRLFTRLLKSRWNEMERFHSGDVINRTVLDTNEVVDFLTTTIPSIVTTAVQLIGAFVFFCMLDSVLPWIIICILPVFFFTGRLYIRRMRAYTHSIRSSDSSIQSVIQEGLQNRTVIQTLEQDQRYLEKLDSLQESLESQVNLRTRFSIISRTMMSISMSGGYLTAFLWGAVKLSSGAITFGTMTAFLQLVSRVQRPGLDLARMVPSLINSLAACERLMELERLPSEQDGEKILFEHTPHLSIDNISFSYESSDSAVFNSLSLNFPPGSSTAVMGQTGKGKTTLVRLLLGLTSPQKGRITLSNHNSEVTVSPLTRSNFVYVPQGNTLLSGSIRDNLLMGNPDATEEMLNRVLKAAVADFVFDLPEGIDTVIAEQGGGLSEGQAQRVAIARALLRPGNIILFDEATSALDSLTEQQLVDNIRPLCVGKSIIFITHHSALADVCERRYSL